MPLNGALQEMLLRLKQLSLLPDFCGIRLAQSLLSCIVCCGSLFVLLFFVIRPLYYMSFDLPLLITTSKLSYIVSGKIKRYSFLNRV